MVSFIGVSNNARSMAGIVTVSGLSFRPSDATPSSRIDGVACGTAAWTSASGVACYSTSGPSIVSSELTVGGLVGTRYAAFSFDGVSGVSQTSIGQSADPACTLHQRRLSAIRRVATVAIRSR